ncbi:hypothetical protein L198_03468 [Cryptococcus wingfieldii CBS 7118]|uniref:Small ribosomal subunit protein mS35 mitochondrial conserved domain-containing protein n=1 Tax=Cryptococcus wingfieldii CBS 7118 TaxID=1295528 RepID=A0A1E3JFM1_9TREE|nr:hypothetical protein L198_03468 [Cryptococcus wingfieldii CBS 7118]ODN99624.1 hypothetical protein L198_03468 [Cryptococcus wingfieldii CBS 7118]
MPIHLHARTARAAARQSARLFSTHSSLSARAPAPSPSSTARTRPWDLGAVPKYAFDDATSLGWMRMFRIEEGEGLVKKIEQDRQVLRAANKTKFTPPTSPIRMTTTIDLSKPDSRFHTKCALTVPVSSLPLKSPEAIHRFKLLAGPRWSPGRPGREEFIQNEDTLGKEGWFKISEERFESSVQNKKSASLTLQKLVEAASDPNSPLPSDIPLDTRHLLARHQKKRSRQNVFTWASGQTFLPRQTSVGGVRGFPIEWLPENLREKALKP